MKTIVAILIFFVLTGDLRWSDTWPLMITFPAIYALSHYGTYLRWPWQKEE